QALETHQIQAFFDGTGTVAKSAKAAGFTVNVTYGSAGTYAYFAYDAGGAVVKPLAKLKVRQALNYALNRKAIANAAVGAYARPISEQPTPDGWVPKFADYYPYDPSKAKALLAAAGYPNGFTIANTNMLNAEPYTSIAEAAASDWAAIGVKVTLQLNASGTWV